MDTQSVPVLDLRHLESRATLAALDAACREWGFFQVINHGLDTAAIAALGREMLAFFRQPTRRKREILRTAANPWGYFDRELTKNTRDWKEIYDYGPADGHSIRPQWPRAMPTFRLAVHAYYAACEVLARRLLGAVALNLGMPREYLDGCFLPSHSSFLRLNHYPRCPQPERPQGLATPKSGHLGLNPHTDAGALTLLLQQAGQPGLEVYRQGAWHLVEPRADALVINIGDIVQVWSNDRYRAALHRVIASAGAERFSVAFFFNPNYESRFAPLPSVIGHGSGAHYRPINWGEFRTLRAAGDYADHGEEIQIHHYRTGNTENDHGIPGNHAA